MTDHMLSRIRQASSLLSSQPLYVVEIVSPLTKRWSVQSEWRTREAAEAELASWRC